jgi:hypothetical protein
VEPVVHATRFEVENPQNDPGTELAESISGRAVAIPPIRRANRGGKNERKLRPKTPPKDLTTLTFFFTAAYTHSAMEELEQERLTRGQERRDGL